MIFHKTRTSLSNILKALRGTHLTVIRLDYKKINIRVHIIWGCPLELQNTFSYSTRVPLSSVNGKCFMKYHRENLFSSFSLESKSWWYCDSIQHHSLQSLSWAAGVHSVHIRINDIWKVSSVMKSLWGTLSTFLSAFSHSNNMDWIYLPFCIPCDGTVYASFKIDSGKITSTKCL